MGSTMLISTYSIPPSVSIQPTVSHLSPVTVLIMLNVFAKEEMKIHGFGLEKIKKKKIQNQLHTIQHQLLIIQNQIRITRIRTSTMTTPTTTTTTATSTVQTTTTMDIKNK